MAEFTSGKTATVKMNVNMNAAGQIAQAGDEVAGTKKPVLHGVKSSATLAEATAVYDAFYGTIAGGTIDSLSAVKTITQGVAE